MVLILYFIAATLFTCSDSLFDTYQKKINASLKSVFERSEYDFKDVAYDDGELKEVLYQGEPLGLLLVAEVPTCNLGGCQIKTYDDKINYESFDLLVILDHSDNILLIKTLDYYSDFGYEITSKKYLKKFVGKSTCAFSKKVDGIDAISGATVSCFALENALSVLCER